MKRGMKVLVLLASFVFSTGSHVFIEKNRNLKNIFVAQWIKENVHLNVCSCDATSERRGRRYQYKVEEFLTASGYHVDDIRRSFEFDYYNIPSEIIDVTEEEIAEILNQRIYNLFKKWFGKVKVTNNLFPMAYGVDSVDVSGLTFYHHTFTMLCGEGWENNVRSKYIISSYEWSSSINPLSLLSSTIESMRGDYYGENISDNIGSSHIERVKGVVGFYIAGNSTMQFVVKHHTFRCVEKVKLFCRLNGYVDPYTRLVIEFVSKDNKPLVLERALMIFPRTEYNLSSKKFENAIVWIKNLENMVR